MIVVTLTRQELEALLVGKSSVIREGHMDADGMGWTEEIGICCDQPLNFITDEDVATGVVGRDDFVEGRMMID